MRPFHDGADDVGARSYGPWSEPGYGRTGTHQPDSEPVVTLVLADSGPVTEGERVQLHIVVSELRNSYRWHEFSTGISVGLEYGWREGGSVLPASSRFGVVPGVFTVDHGLGGHRDFRVSLPDYAADHGPLTITLQPGDGYRVGEIASVCVSIADSETLEATPCPDDEDTTGSDSQAGDAPLSIAVQDARATEGVDEVISFEVSLSAAAGEPVTVDWSTADGTATAGQDYVASTGPLTFAAGETAHTIEVTVLDDAHDEGEETFALRLSNAAGAELADGEATGTIVNSDPMPRAWLGRFGRTAWEQTLDAVDQRLRSARTPATRAAVAGREMTAAGTDRVAGEKEIAALAAWIDNGNRDPQARTMSGQELLAGSEFQVATAASEDGSVLTVWGQGAYGHFGGRDGDLAVDGDVATGTLGVDYATGPWMAGLALSHSSGWGRYAQPMTSGGEVTSTLTGAYPYVGFEVVPERLSLWVAGGYGLGGLRLSPADGEPMETRINLLASAAGVRGTVVPASVTGGFSLGLNADGMLLRAASEAASGVAATTADVNRIRLGLEGSYEVALGGSSRLTPSVEVGVRRDGGTAETGFGMDVGGGLSYTHPGLGLSLGLNGRALVLHESADVAEWGASGWLAWDPNPGSELGPALTVTPVDRRELGRRSSATVEPRDAGRAGHRSDRRERYRTCRRQVRLRHAARRRRRGAVGRHRPRGARTRIPLGLRLPRRRPVGHRSADRAGGSPPRARQRRARAHALRPVDGELVDVPRSKSDARSLAGWSNRRQPGGRPPHRVKMRHGSAQSAVGLGAATVAASLVAGLLGPLAVGLYAAVLSLPAWMAGWHLGRRA